MSDSPKRLFALVDCNNFYVSCERIFDSRLLHKPVVVLSNNDGCAISRSQEAKDLGIKMGAPWFEIRHLAQSHGLVARSSNYALYGIMSNRVMSILRDMAPGQEVYSIDESFLDMTGIADPVALGRMMHARVLQWTHIPVCVGIASTKTRAKLANHIAKKSRKCRGVFNLESLTKEQEDGLLGKIRVGEVWGVGRRISDKLSRQGIFTVRDLQRCDPDAIKDHFSVVLARTVSELQGTSCLSLEDVAPPKQQIMVSRSFGALVTRYDDLREAVVHYVTRAGEKLRNEGLTAHTLTVFAHSNPFREEDPQYSGSRVVPLVTPTQDTRKLIAAALAGLKDLYIPEINYKKAGVMLTDLVNQDIQQEDLFDVTDSDASKRLMQTIDAINDRQGRGTVYLSAEGGNHRSWRMQSKMRSPAYMSSWADIRTART
jgi:DNA polymerase V